MKNRGPVIVVLILMFTLIFIGGVRYGERVEKANKTISYIISLTPPTRPPTQAPTPYSVKYKKYENKQCPVSFLYPSYLKKVKETSQSAEFNQDEIPQLAFSCEAKKPKFEDFDESVPATESAKTNQLNGKRTYFKLNPDLVPLLDSSIEFKVK